MRTERLNDRPMVTQLRSEGAGLELRPPGPRAGGTWHVAVVELHWAWVDVWLVTPSVAQGWWTEGWLGPRAAGTAICCNNSAQAAQGKVQTGRHMYPKIELWRNNVLSKGMSLKRGCSRISSRCCVGHRMFLGKIPSSPPAMSPTNQQTS